MEEKKKKKSENLYKDKIRSKTRNEILIFIYLFLKIFNSEENLISQIITLKKLF